MGNVHPLLPSLKFPSTEFLEPPELLELFVFVVMVVQVQFAHLVKAPRELAPGALPLDVASLSASPSEAFPRSNVVSADISRIWASDMLRTRRSLANLGGWRFIHELEEMGTLHAVPVAVGNALETDAVGMVCSIAAIAQEEDIFTLGGVADRARVALFFFFFGVIA